MSVTEEPSTFRERDELGTVAELLGDAAQQLAERVSRRSLLGRFGLAAVASAVGVPAAALLDPALAQAHMGNSDWCYNIFGTSYCDTTYGCYCGCWNSGPCSYCDCCQKSGGTWCSNHGGCTGHGLADTTRHSCCFPKEWSEPAGCGSLGSTLIICRDGFC